MQAGKGEYKMHSLKRNTVLTKLISKQRHLLKRKEKQDNAWSAFHQIKLPSCETIGLEESSAPKM